MLVGNGGISISLDEFSAAIFDMDGTMVDNMRYHKKAWQEFLRKYETTLTDIEFEQRISGKKNSEIFEIVFGDTLPADEQELSAEKEEFYRDSYRSSIREVPGLAATIAEIQQRGIKTAIATTAPDKNRQFVLNSLNLLNEFDIILGEEHVSLGKPHPEIYLSVAGKLDVEPKRCLVFEDSPAGISSAKSAGMVVIGILSSHSAEALRAADHLVRDYREISFV